MSKSFNIIICGAGIAGLGAAIALRRTGHKVTVLEAASQLNEVGAGIQIPPNSTRILLSYGLEDKLLEKVVWPNNINIRRYATGEVIGLTPLHPFMSENYGFPYWLIHRADYQRILYHAAKEEGVEVLLGSPVERVDEDGPAVYFEDGRALQADLVVGADGIRSKTRKSILKDRDVKAVDSPNCAYRATVPASVMKSDAMISHLMTDPNSNMWIGPERHIVGYPICNGELYNLVMSHPGQASVGRWNEPGNLDEMKGHYSDFDPIIRRALEKVESCKKWKLAYLPPLPKWISDTGNVVLIGDAAHGMLPYFAQGAAASIEDGACLAACLSRARGLSDLPKLVNTYEALRKPRCETISFGAKDNGDVWHLADGLEQQIRDSGMRDMMDKMRSNEGEDHLVGNKWNDKDFQPWLFGYDTVKETNDFLDKLSTPSYL